MMFVAIALLCISSRLVAQQPDVAKASRSRPSINAADNATLAHLDRFKALLAEGELQEAIETIRQVAETSGKQFVQTSTDEAESAPGFHRHLPLATYCNIRLAELAVSHPEALALYRQQVDAVAQRLLMHGVDNRDEASLRKLVSKYFASSHTDAALMRLGEFALERGEWTEARGYWEQISPLTRFPPHLDPQYRIFKGQPLWLITRLLRGDEAWSSTLPLLGTQDGTSTWLAYRDSDHELSGLLARLTLVSILEGHIDRAKTEIELIRRLFPDTEGEIRGQRGTFVELLEQILDESQQWPPLSRETSWPTVAGSPDRQRVTREINDVAAKPKWQLALPTYSADGELLGSEGTRVGEDLDGLLSYFPVVVDGKVILQGGATENDVSARGINDGSLVFGPATFTGDVLMAPGLKRSVGVPRFPLSAHGTTVYARVGSLPTGTNVNFQQEREESARIVGFDLQAEGRLTLDLRLEGPNWDKDWAFDGVPLSDGQDLFIALRHRTSVRSESYVACFDARTGRFRWRTMLVGAEPVGVDRSFELTHTLLTLRNRTLFCNTNLGIVAAIATQDGAVNWMVEYPRVDLQSENPDRDARNLFRDLNPCLVYRDLVITAPTDCDRLFALDANTGIIIWATDRERAAGAIHLLGVGQGNLLASGDYLYWFDVYTGQLLSQFPPPHRSLPGLAKPSPCGHGRGILAGKHVYWPTRESILVFDQQVLRDRIGRTPKAAKEIDLISRGATGGNLIVADNFLLIAAKDRLIVFDTNGNTIEHE